MKLGKRRRDAARINGPLCLEPEAGAPYRDEPVYRDVMVYLKNGPETVKQISHYRRVPLRWLNPDGSPR